MPGPDRTAAPAPGADPRIETPEWATRRLPSGLRVEVCTDHRTPDVALRLVGDAGAGCLAPGDAGLATLAGELLIEGADGKSAVEMAEWLDAMGASFMCRAGYDSSVISMHTLVGELDGALELLSATAWRPDFAAGEVDRVREKRIDRIKRRADEPAEIAGERLIGAIFGLHPYGVPADGSEASVARIDADAVRAFWHSRFRPSSAALVVCGDVTAEEAFAAAEACFGEWSEPAPAPSSRPELVGEPSRASEVLLVNRPASRQTEIRIGGIGIERGAANEVQVLVMNAILGGLFNSRINMNLREDKGWTYGARSTFLRRRSPGPFVVRTAVDTEVTVGAFEQIRMELEAMVAAPPTDEELTLARNALTLALPLQFETKGQIAGRRVETLTYDLADDYWTTFSDVVRAVTPQQVQDMARDFLDPSRLVYLAVGDVARFAGNLAPFGPVEVVEVG
jgi:zinc protease